MKVQEVSFVYLQKNKVMVKKLKVQNIKCEGCASNITQVLNKLDGTYVMEVNITEGLVKIEVMDEQAYDKAEGKLIELGYPLPKEKRMTNILRNLFK